jgi:hypothetical protein
MGAALLTAVASGIQGIRLAMQAPDGAVAVQTGNLPSPDTPEKPAGIQRTLGTLSTLNVVVGIALVAANGVLAQITRAIRQASPLHALVISECCHRPPRCRGDDPDREDPRHPYRSSIISAALRQYEAPHLTLRELCRRLLRPDPAAPREPRFRSVTSILDVTSSALQRAEGRAGVPRLSAVCAA